jgi:signal transduction histidine kinase/CheY-like chemotaxis protein
MDTFVTLAIEALFVIVFGAALYDYLAHRNPVGRDLALVLAGLAGLFAVALYRSLIGEPPPLLSVVAGIALLLQPFFTLLLVSRVRPVPRSHLAVLLGVLVATTTLLFAAGPNRAPILALPAIASFAAGELYAAALLGLEARGRLGSSRVRLTIASLSTALFGAAFLVLLVGLVGAPAAQVGNVIARILALGAAIGYVAAFLPPRPVRRLWQTASAFPLAERVFDLAEGSTSEIWSRFLDTAIDVVGGSAGLVVESVNGSSRIRAAVDMDPAALDARAMDTIIDETTVQQPIGDRLPAGITPPGTRFIGVIGFTPAPGASPLTVIVLTRYRSLFWADDAALVRILASRASIVAERRDALGRQESLTNELRETVAALEDASRAKSDFLASMSHELRTPLNAIIGFSDLMRAEPSEGDRRSVPIEWIEHIARGGHHLLSLINDVLDLAKVEAGRLELRRERVEVSQLAMDVAAGLRPLADRKRIQVETVLPEATLVDADRGRLRQVLYNLLSNAIKFTPDEGRIGLSVEGGDEAVEITVSDSGVGIDPADLDRIFQEFAQVGPAESQVGGTGLGLALARRLVEAHGGTIGVESTLGSGSTFTVRLPAAHGEAVSHAPDRPATSDTATGSDVLIIEDDPSAARLLRQYLETAGYPVRIAIGGEPGLEESRRRPPAAILLDVLLPDIDGWEVLRELKADERLRDIPVIIVTIVDERDVGLALGAVDYFVKPIDRRALMTSLARLTLVNKVKHGPVRILAVDDDPVALDFIAATLEPEGFDVLRADGGPEALSIVARTAVDLVICDLVMPGMDGIEVVSALRARDSTRETPIIISTAHHLTAADKERLHGEILDVVEKGPHAQEKLRTWLERVVRHPEPANSHDG